MTRRRLLRDAALLGAAAWAPAFRLRPGQGPPGPDLPGFPTDVPRHRQAFTNWSGAIAVDDVWTCTPRNFLDVLAVADWAVAHDYRIRPRGAGHNWSPLVVTGDEDAHDRVVLLSTVEHLSRADVLPGDPPRVRAQAGVRLEDLLTLLGEHGLGLTATPAIGDATIGGMFAIGAHGTAVPAVDEVAGVGTTYGSLADRVVEMTVVCWDRILRRHKLVTVDRRHPGGGAVLTNLGRMAVLDVTMDVASDDNLRCESRLDIPADELLGAPARGGRSVSSFLDGSGRVEVIWFPFTERPWLKVWTIAPDRPEGARFVSEPYNYPFADNLPDPVVHLATQAATSHPAAAELLGPASHAAVVAGLTATDSWDLWGPSRSTLLYVRATTLRVDTDGYAVVTARRDVQQVLHTFHEVFLGLLEEHRRQGSYPANMAVELRVTGVDDAARATPGARRPALSPVVVPDGRPDLDSVVFLNSLSLPGTVGRDDFWAELESRLRAAYATQDVVFRPEWSKGWAYTPAGPWTDGRALDGWVPASFGRSWAWAVERLRAFDPNGVFTNPFVDRLLEG